MKVSFIYDNGFLIQLRFAFRRCLKAGVSFHGKKKLQRANYSRQQSLEPQGMTQAWHKFRIFTVISIAKSSARFWVLQFHNNFFTYNFSCGKP